MSGHERVETTDTASTPSAVHNSQGVSGTSATPAPSLVCSGSALFKVLVDMYECELRAFARGIVGDMEQARDIVQEAFYDAWRAAERQAQPFCAGCPGSDVRRWLFHATYCRAISALRHRRRHPYWQSLDHMTDVDLSQVTVERNPEPLEDQIAEREVLRAAFASLLPNDCACLLLVTVQGFSAKEAAQILGTSPQALAKRYSRAKRKLLRAYLAQEAPSHPPSHGGIQV